MSAIGTAPAWPDWQDEDAYAYCAQLTGVSWAWEFLRRNPGFQRDLALASHRIESSRSKHVAVISLAAGAVDLSVWGLIFCKLKRE